MTGLCALFGKAFHHPTARRRGALAAAVSLSLGLNALPLMSGWKSAARPHPATPAMTARIIDAATTLARAEAQGTTLAAQQAPVLSEPRPVRSSPIAPADQPASTTVPPAASAAPAAPNRPEPGAPRAAVDESSLPPRPLGEIVPAYPEAADGKRGHVLLQLSIDDQGRVVRADVLEATPPGYFEDSARTAFLAARFQPALLNGVPVRSQITIQVDYEPGDRDGAVLSPRY